MPASADVLLLDAIESAPPNSESGIMRPTRGMKKGTVMAKFGEPTQKLGPVGDPPISRWVYDDFTVYFERQIAITAVVHHR